MMCDAWCMMHDLSWITTYWWPLELVTLDLINIRSYQGQVNGLAWPMTHDGTHIAEVNEAIWLGHFAKDWSDKTHRQSSWHYDDRARRAAAGEIDPLISHFFCTLLKISLSLPIQKLFTYSKIFSFGIPLPLMNIYGWAHSPSAVVYNVLMNFFNQNFNQNVPFLYLGKVKKFQFNPFTRLTVLAIPKAPHTIIS